MKQEEIKKIAEQYIVDLIKETPIHLREYLPNEEMIIKIFTDGFIEGSKNK
jgi:hypothetical protein